ncbi:MAG: ABC transporter ATP-binding protein [Proteobacteria bacterium]|nr:ABC transporter ATP-binding protein [Pseudomonadota bacterium]
MGTQIDIQNLTKRYGKNTVLDNLNLTIKNGEFLVLLGPSGCGKTTLLRCIAGLETPESGEIKIGNTKVYSSEQFKFTAPGKRNLGMVFQSYALWPHMTVRDNIGFGLKLLKMSKEEIEQKVITVLKELSMEGLEKRYPSELSGGQQQRIALARLLVTRPPLFLMDEPLSNLDARLRVDMRSEIKRLHREIGVTTVYVTHDQTEALTLSDRIVIMKNGLIQQVATPHEIYKKPANLFAAEFMAMPQINVFPAEISGQKDGLAQLIIDDFTLSVSSGTTTKKVTAVVRPEDIVISRKSASGSVEFSVQSVMPSGPESYIQLKRNQRTFLVRETQHLDLEIDQPVWIRIDPSAVNLYDTATGELLVD